jgi:N6-adenosine-specific RNA methylase IME4
MSEQMSLTRYEAAREALAEAVRVDEVQQVRNAGLQMKAYARIAKDRKLQADAAAIVIRAERKLGVLIQSAKETGQLGIGRPSRSNVAGKPDPEDADDGGEMENGSSAEPFTRATLSEAGIDKKLSMRAQNWARMGDADFEAKLQEVRDRIESTGAAVVNPQKDLKTADKKARRAEREAELGARQRALPDKVFGVIYADPEWRFEPYSRETGLDRAADNHYPTSELDEIMARPVIDIAAPDSVLFLWATAPMLPQALAVMAAWGFAYKSHVIWHKTGATGTGYWFRSEHELLLVGTRGDVPAPAPGTQWPSILSEAPGAHSAKPEGAYRLIEAYYPNLPRIELNARQARAGWEAWGYEAPEQNSPEGESSTAREASGGKRTEQSEMRSLQQGPEAAPHTHSNSPDDQADRGGPDPHVSAASSPTHGRPAGPGQRTATPDGAIAADPWEGTAAAGEGETGQEIVLPFADVPPGELTTQQKNAIIRAGYGQNAPVALLAARTGLSRDSVKQRARTMKLGSRERQRSMASAFATQQQRARREAKQ